MKKQLLNLLLVAAFVFAASLAKAQYSEPDMQMDVPAIDHAGAIAMDGVAEADYSDFIQMKIAKRAGAALTDYEDGDASDFNAQFKVCWDGDYLYYYLEVTDDIAEYYGNDDADPYGQSWTWDNSEVFIDLDTNSTTNTYDVNSTTQMRFNPGLLSDAGDDSLVESNSRGKVDQYQFWEDAEAPGGWKIEVAIPWAAATAQTDPPDVVAITEANGIMGFDAAVADADGDGSDHSQGGRNVEGGAQMFWDLDTPIGNEDNAYQNRRTLGWIALTGTVGLSPVSQQAIDVWPNPVSDKLNIKNYSGPVTIYSIIGTEVMEINNVTGAIDVSRLSSGVYVVATEKGTARILKK
jgi:hypothetical protein